MPFGTNQVIAVLPVAGTSLAGRRPHGKFQPAGFAYGGFQRDAFLARL